MNTATLITRNEFDGLRKGTVLVSINGNVVRKGYDAISMDERCGRLAYNVVRKTVKELRAAAKSIGMKGYSRLRKVDLVKALIAFVGEPVDALPVDDVEAPAPGHAKSEAYARSINFRDVDLMEPILRDNGEVAYYGGMSNGRIVWR